MNLIPALQGFGQSVWLDDLRHSLFTSGELARLISQDRLLGVTSNPAIFESAIVDSAEYADAIEAIDPHRTLAPKALYEALAIRDVRAAADLLRPAYDATGGADGYVSLEVSPLLAHQTTATIEEGRRLWTAIGRDNAMIKVPASLEGLPAIRQLTSEGINVNITLLFGISRYEAVARAYMDGLDAFVQQGGDPRRVSSVASFFVSRIDTLVDELIAARLAASANPETRALLTGLLGHVAIANARLAYQSCLALGRTPEWRALAAVGAQPQRLLWASTTTRNPRYRDVRYVEELIGRDTVNTMTPATIAAFRDHGKLRASLEERPEQAHHILATLARVGIPIEQVADRLLEDGIARFTTAFDALLSALANERAVVGQ